MERDGFFRPTFLFLPFFSLNDILGFLMLVGNCSHEELGIVAAQASILFPRPRRLTRSLPLYLRLSMNFLPVRFPLFAFP